MKNEPKYKVGNIIMANKLWGYKQFRITSIDLSKKYYKVTHLGGEDWRFNNTYPIDFIDYKDNFSLVTKLHKALL